MRVKKVTNTSDEDVRIKVGRGINITLSPGEEFKNVRVENLDEIKDKVSVVSDLGEICDSSAGANKLYD